VYCVVHAPVTLIDDGPAKKWRFFFLIFLRDYKSLFKCIHIVHGTKLDTIWREFFSLLYHDVCKI
jgi:hypothetical protein